MLLNPYRALLNLLPDQPVLVGTVTAVSGGEAWVTLLGGGVQVVRGEATVGQMVYIRDGLVEGEAPSLTLEDIVI